MATKIATLHFVGGIGSVSLEVDQAAEAGITLDEIAFRDAIEGLTRGDFSRLEPLFGGEVEPAERRPRIVEWHQQGRFLGEPGALAEALTCACFLGRTVVAEYLLEQGVDPAGGIGTGLNALHWAANRGQVAAVRLLIRWHAPFEARSGYDGTVLGTAVWAAINERRPGQLEVIEALLTAGARQEEVDFPTGYPPVDAVLGRHRAP